ncbi:MAG: protein-L-isoaspartate(D-aspartate) O-methyltransferase [Fimbriimonadales bacterium]
MNGVDGVDYSAQQAALIEQIRARGIRDERVLDAMRRVPRHLLVPPEQRPFAYVDHALPIEEGQTISQPSLVAQMTSLLRLQGHERVLEVGTGSGYQSAILRLLCHELITIERFPRLALNAFHRLRPLKLPPMVWVIGDGTRGFPPYAPYDCILVTAGCPERVPPPFLEQLSPSNGRLLLPMGTRSVQHLTLITKHGDRLTTRTYGECVFVPLVGKYGWSD